jgi:xanthine dehydrogenase molybdopterin-binding subunit B
MLKLEFSICTSFTEFSMDLSHAVKDATDGHCSKWYYNPIISVLRRSSVKIVKWLASASYP